MFATLRLGIAPLILSLTCGSCRKESGHCDYLVDGYERLHTDLNSLPLIPLEQISEAVVGEVQKCWATHPYGGPQHSLRLQAARQAGANGYYLIFEPSGIQDVALVFQVNAESRVTGGYQSSTFE
jgi:hypothetical protein